MLKLQLLNCTTGIRKKKLLQRAVFEEERIKTFTVLIITYILQKL
jgi:hypothetical protein